MEYKNAMENNLMENIDTDKDPYTSAIDDGGEPYGEQGLISKDSVDEPDNKIFQERKIVSKILSAYDFGYLDLLKFRQVCKVWNDVICRHESRRESLWTKACLCIGRNKLAGQKSWDIFIKLNLNTRFHCPNFWILQQDLRHGYNRDFFLVHGLFIKNLKLDHCKMSLLTFQEIINLCSNLECLEVIKVSDGVIHTESLTCPSNSNLFRPHLTTELNKLQSLILHHTHSNNVSLENMHNIYFPIPPPDLHPVVLAELLEFARPLERIKLVGWGGKTVTSILGILANNPTQNPFVKHLEFQQIQGSIDAAEFYSYVQHTRHLSLQTFALTFQTQESCDGGQRRNIRRMLRKLLSIHGKFLLELDLTNCPVNEEIFHQYDLNLPKLEKLILIGTEAEEVFSVYGLMPRLHILEIGPEIKKSSVGEIQEFSVDAILVDHDDCEEILKTNYFETLSAFDNVCMRSLGGFGSFFAWRLLDHYNYKGPMWNSLLFLCVAVINFLPHLVVKKRVDKLKKAQQIKKFLKNIVD